MRLFGIGEEHSANSSRKDSKIMVFTPKGGLSWRSSPPLRMLRMTITSGTAAAHSSFELLLCWLPKVLQRELQPQPGAQCGGKSASAAFLRATECLEPCQPACLQPSEQVLMVQSMRPVIQTLLLSSPAPPWLQLRPSKGLVAFNKLTLLLAKQAELC